MKIAWLTASRIGQREELADAIEEMFATDGSYLLEVEVDRHGLSHGTSRRYGNQCDVRLITLKHYG